MSEDSEREIPQCPHPDGHAWVSGRAEKVGERELKIISRQCRRCFYEDEF